MSYMQAICVFLQKGVLRLLADYEVIGRENVPPMGPLIIVANHQSNLDPSMLACAIPRRIQFLAKDGLFINPVASWFLRSYGAFPLNREGLDLRAYRWTLHQLARDGALVLFPEGTRSRGSMGPAHPGVAKLALQSQAPLLPVGIAGTERLHSILRHVNPTGTIRINIGTPFSLPVIEGRPDRAVVNSLSDMIMERIAALLPERYHGVYAGRRGVAGGFSRGGSVGRGDQIASGLTR